MGVYAQRLAAERELFSRLSIEEMEEIAAESQALVDKVAAMARANSAALVPATVRREPVAITATDRPKDTGAAFHGDLDGPLNRNCVQVAARVAGEPPSAAAAVHDVATGASAEPPAGSTDG